MAHCFARSFLQFAAVATRSLRPRFSLGSQHFREKLGANKKGPLLFQLTDFTLVVARRRRPDRHAGPADRERIRLAAASGHQPQPENVVNFPMQSDGAEMLRLAAQRLVEVGIVPCMLIHDGVLLEAQSEEQVEHAQEIMRWAGARCATG